MKNIFLILLMVFMIGTGYAVHPARKPFIQIKIDGKSYKNGDILTVTPGQKLIIGVELEGGRRDYCNFPETYADITSTAQILSRGKDGLTYLLNGENAEWKLLNEETHFTADEFVQVKSRDNQSTAEITVTNAKFSQYSVRFTMKANWQFNQNGQTSQEENLAEGTIYFQVAGTSNVWFSSQNIQASGIKNDLVQERLNAIKNQCDSIENNIYKLKFSAVQRSIRNLQDKADSLKMTIDKVIAGNPAYKVKVTFIGLPSDHPFDDIEELSIIKSKWDSLSILVNNLKQELVKLPSESSKENKDKLINIITQYNDWQKKLSQNSFTVISRYIPEINIENIKIPDKIRSIIEEKAVSDYSQTINDFQTFLDARIVQVSDELQKINSIHTRIQVVRLFDGMLRSYFSSINWAEWKSTRAY